MAQIVESFGVICVSRINPGAGDARGYTVRVELKPGTDLLLTDGEATALRDRLDAALPRAAT